MQKRFYNKESINKLIVVKKPLFISSNSYLTKIKKKYKNKKAGFSGTLDPFAKGCLIVAFGQYSKLFKYLKKTPKKIFLLVVANAIRYPPQHEISRFGGFFRGFNCGNLFKDQL